MNISNSDNFFVKREEDLLRELYDVFFKLQQKYYEKPILKKEDSYFGNRRFPEAVEELNELKLALDYLATGNENETIEEKKEKIKELEEIKTKTANY